MVKSIRRFRSHERGSLTIFALFLFVLILMIAGTAVDMALHERSRAALQDALDTAVLAAASESQQGDPDAVMRDYVAKAGFDPDQINFTYNRDNGVTTAFATAPVQTSTLFMGLMGIDELHSNSGSRAAEGVTSTEISLVLDFTSSMHGNRRLALVDAVKGFVNVVYDLNCDSNGDNCVAPADPPNVRINVVPYGGTVNPGRQMADLMGLQRWHEYSSCGVIPAASYDNTELPAGATQQYPHYYMWHRSERSAQQEFGWCPQDNNTILYSASDPEAIKTYVANLQLNDGTGSQIGLKWGMALLDPSSRDEINTVTANPSGTFPQDHSGSVLKVAVVMTDGGITSQRMPYVELGTTPFNFDHLYDENGDLIAPNMANDSSELDPALPSFAEREAIYERFGSEDETGEARDRSVIEYAWGGSANSRTSYDLVSQADAITDFTKQCNEAKTRVSLGNGAEKSEVLVYTVRFLETAQYTEDYLRPCAETFSHYFDVTTVGGLGNVFSSIADHISNQALSLTN